MHIITGKSFDEVYRKSIYEILNKGEVVAPRGSKTFELSPATIVIEDARKFLSMPRLRRGNYTFQQAETLWMLRGSDDLEEIAHYNSVWRNFEDQDEPGILNGAYGWRLRNWGGDGENQGIDQFFEVYEKLKKDPYSRQAVAIIWDPERDNYTFSDGNYSKDIPCTNYFVFQIRNNKLNLMTVMRSNDLHKGTIYDIPTFMIFQNIIAGWLGIEVGKYTHVAASFHIYESDVENLHSVYEDTDDEFVYKDGVDYGDPRLSLDDFNKTMSTVNFIEYSTRCSSYNKEIFDGRLQIYIDMIKEIENFWWRSVAAQIVMYNYRKSGATEEEFKVFLPYISNEYRSNVEKWKTLKGRV